MQRSAAGLFFTAAALCFSPSLFANPEETFGAGARAAGLASAATAAARTADACFYNPAALSNLQNLTATIGLLFYRPFLTISGSPSPANTFRFLESLRLGAPIPLGSGLNDLLFIGIDLVVPGLDLYSIKALPRTAPHFPFLEDRNRRLVLNAAFAIKPHRTFAIGAGFSLLPHVYGDVRVDFVGSGSRSSTQVAVKANLSPNLGLLFTPLKNLSLGIAWRGANRTRLRIPTSVDIAKVPPIALEVEAYEYSTPHVISFGLAYLLEPVLLSADFGYHIYSAFRQSAPSVTLFDSSGQVSKTIQVPDPGFKNTFSLRAGAEVKVKDFTVRGGLAFLQSPVPPQEGETNLLDGDKFVVSCGAGLDLSRLTSLPLRFDAYLSYLYLVPNRDEKLIPDTTNPGYPNIEGRGGVLSAGLDFEVVF